MRSISGKSQPAQPHSPRIAAASPTLGGGLIREDKVVTQASKKPTKTPVSSLQVPQWRGFDFLLHGFSTRAGGETKVYRPAGEEGELNLGFTASDPARTVSSNRSAFVNEICKRAATGSVTKSPRLITLKQVHSSIIHRVGAEDGPQSAILKGDGLMTNETGILLAIQTADCIPVLVVDRKRRAVAAFHAGWRGTLKRIVEAGVGRMRLEFGSRPEDLEAAIGPGIGQCCYSVGEEVQGEFESQFSYSAELFREVYDSDPIREKYPMLFMTARAPGHSGLGPSIHLDLVEANRRQLQDAGLRTSSIHAVAECTSCRTDRYFSHRAERGFTGRMMSVVGVI